MTTRIIFSKQGPPSVVPALHDGHVAVWVRRRPGHRRGVAAPPVGGGGGGGVGRPGGAAAHAAAAAATATWPGPPRGGARGGAAADGPPGGVVGGGGGVRAGDEGPRPVSPPQGAISAAKLELPAPGPRGRVLLPYRGGGTGAGVEGGGQGDVARDVVGGAWPVARRPPAGGGGGLVVEVDDVEVAGQALVGQERAEAPGRRHGTVIGVLEIELIEMKSFIIVNVNVK